MAAVATAVYIPVGPPQHDMNLSFYSPMTRLFWAFLACLGERTQQPVALLPALRYSTRLESTAETQARSQTAHSTPRGLHERCMGDLRLRWHNSGGLADVVAQVLIASNARVIFGI